MRYKVTPATLILRLLAYFAVVTGIVVTLLATDSDLLDYLPFGGTHALGMPGIEVDEAGLRFRDASAPAGTAVGTTPADIGRTALLLAGTLVTTIVAMIPLTWTYLGTRYDAGPSKVFVWALVLMPICATTVVLLIQDSLALAFGLAALVAAVRFRVNLSETIDGIYVFAAVCIGLAGGIGYMGVALVMSLVFTLSHAVMWRLEYGQNPVDETRQAVKAAKLAAKAEDRKG